MDFQTNDIIHHRVKELEHKHTHMNGELREVKDAISDISTQTKMMTATLVEMKDALTKVANSATDIQLVKQQTHEMKIEYEKVHDLMFKKISETDRLIEYKEERIRADLDKRTDKIFNEIKESKKEYRDEQTWFKRLVYSAIIVGLIGIGLDIVKGTVVVEKQYHITNNPLSTEVPVNKEKKHENR